MIKNTIVGTQRSYAYVNPTLDLLEILPEELRYKVEDCIIDYDRIELGNLIGQGEYA